MCRHCGWNETRESGTSVPAHDAGVGLRVRPLWIVLLAGLCGAAPMAAQQPSAMAANSGLPDAPEVNAAGGAPAAGSAQTKGSAAVSGTVLDSNESEVQGARVVLKSVHGHVRRVLHSGGNGEFTFTAVPAGDFKLKVSGPGWGTYVSPMIHLYPGDFRIVTGIVLPVAVTATVEVNANPVQLSEEQVQIAERQRVLGVIPNLYSSYNWNAPPMEAQQKFQLALRLEFDPVTVAGVAAVAGIEQMNNNFAEYGQGAEGYAKRFGAAYADDFTAKMLSNAVFPSLFHQDPRYFYRGKGSFGSRAVYAISAAVITRGDNGRREPNYSRILGSLTAGAISNLYYPAGDRGVTLTLANGLVDIADNAGENLVREFVLKRLTKIKAAKTGHGQ